VALYTLDISFRWEGLGVHFRVPVLPAGEVGEGKNDGARADFWIPSVLACALPGPSTTVARVPISEPYGKISEKAYSGK
jgi:hypothetical protein